MRMSCARDASGQTSSGTRDLNIDDAVTRDPTSFHVRVVTAGCLACNGTRFRVAELHHLTCCEGCEVSSGLGGGPCRLRADQESGCEDQRPTHRDDRENQHGRRTAVPVTR